MFALTNLSASECLNRLEPFMLHNVGSINNGSTNLKDEDKKGTDSVKHKDNDKKDQKANKYKKSSKSEDKYFWCFYKLLHNYLDEDLANINPFTVEKEFKIKAVDLLRKNKALAKKHKLRIHLIEDELVNEKKISSHTLEGLCMIYSMNLMIIKDNNTYSTMAYGLENIDSTNYKFIKISKTSEHVNDITIAENMTALELATIIKDYYYIANIDKPLKAVSSYKVDELITIAEKLKINVYAECKKKKKKTDLYEEITKMIC